jgi:hypothetical protein
MFFNKKNLLVLVILVAFLCIISFLLGVFMLKNGTIRKAYDIFFALTNIDQKNLDFKESEVNKIDTLQFIYSKKKQNKLIKIRSDKFNNLESIVTYGQQWFTERPWIKSKFKLNNDSLKKGKFKLIGMNPDHFREANNWSVRVKLSGENYIYKYQKFNLLVPFSRGFFVDAFYNTLYKRIGGLSIDSKPIVTRIRDQYTLQIFEPFFSKELIENQGYRDGLILSEDSTDRYGKPHLKVVHPNSFNSLTSDQRRIYTFYEQAYQKRELRNYYDVKQYAFLAAVAINTGNTLHHFGGFNLYIYANPISGNLMPFLREIGFIPQEIPQQQLYQKIKSDFLKATGLNQNNYKNFTAFNQNLNSYSFSINSTNIDSLISKNDGLKSLYYYSTAYFPWSFAYKKRIRVQLKFSDNSKIEKIKNEKAKNAPIQRIYSNGVFYLNNLSINQDVHVKNATIIFSGLINSIGTKKIKIIGDAASTLLFENSIVRLKNIEFIGFGNQIKLPNRALTSAITFYKSNINLEQVSFSGNYSGDDLINIFRSTFKLENLKLKNSNFDGIDFDYSTGEINNSSILNCGNDGLDFGGSQVKVKNTSISNCGDKGISIGEKSGIYLSNTKIQNSEIGIGLKDESLANIRALKVSKNHLDLAVYGKKGLYDVPILNILPDDFRNLHYLIEPDVRVMNHLKYQTTLQAKKFLYGRKYGKASIR